MKSIMYAFMAIAILAGLLFNPFTALPVSAETCGDTYTVQRGDYLSKIAKYCGVSLNTIIDANPEIKNINLVYTGQVIRIKADATIPVTGETSGTYTVVRGDYLSLIAKRFGTTVTAILKVNPEIKNPSLLFVGQVIKLPSGTTTDDYYYSQVTLSTRSAKAGAQVEVKVTGLPANAEVDFRLGKSGEAYSVVVDGKTDSNGAVTGKVTIPSTAAVNEKWVVKIMTTSIAKGVEITSPTITIIN